MICLLSGKSSGKVGQLLYMPYNKIYKQTILFLLLFCINGITKLLNLN